MRIVSFLPSATEILFALGLSDQVVGVTFECDFPPAARTLPRVVHTSLPPGLPPAEIDRIVAAAGAAGRNLYLADFELLESLAPDLVVTQDLCHVCALDSPTLARNLALLRSRPRMLSLSAHSLQGVFDEIMQVGRLTGVLPAAQALVASLQARLETVRALPVPSPRPRVLALEWLHPFFQGGHWVPEMIALAGGWPVLAEPGAKSVRLTWEQVREADPEVLIVMPCGYDLPQAVSQYSGLALPTGWEDLRASKDRRIYAVDGSAYFSRPGPRLVDGVELLAALLRDQPGAYIRL